MTDTALRIAILGGGVMGETLAAGFLARLEPTPAVVIAEKRPERAAELADRLGVRVASMSDAVSDADVVVLAVKPQDFRAMLAELAPCLRSGALVISIAAGISTTMMEELMPSFAVIRVMPNTPARINRGVAGISAGSACTAADLDLAARLMESVGVVVRVPESLQDAVTAVSGSGPAYVFYLAEAMIAAGMEMGLSAADARVMTVNTILGAGELLAASDEDPAVLRANVTSPNGTTAAAIASMEASSIRDAIKAAMTAARDRSIELSGS
jgi:pyrroline-5-carboxylate reductase